LDLEDLKRIIDEFKKWDLTADKSLLGFVTSSKLKTIMGEVQKEPENLSGLENMDNLLNTLKTFPIDLDLWRSQNIYFTLCQDLERVMQERERSGNPLARQWMGLMKNIGSHLSVKCM